MRKTATLFVLCAVISMPVFAHAQTFGELQAQITALLARLAALQQQLGIVPPATPTPPAGGPTTSATPTPPATAGSITQGGFTLARDLSRGDSSADVSQLQTFLARDASIYPEGQVTGTYGPLTEAAVQRFQKACGIVSSGDSPSTGYGKVGPKTRAALQGGCKGAPSGLVGGLLRVSPTLGNAPLTVSALVTVNTANTCDYATYALDFGDGTPQTQITVPAGRCAALEQTIPHTYTAAGIYTISLRIGSHYATSKVSVSAPSAVNTGTTPSTDSITANLSQGAAPLAVIFTAHLNASRVCTARDYTLTFGDGQSVPLQHPANFCSASTATVAHTYVSAGTFVAKLYAVPESQVASAAPISSFLVTVAGSSGSSSTFDPQLTLTPGADGGPLQKVKAAFRLSTPCVPFTLDWGDGSAPVTRAHGGGVCTQVVDEHSHVHTYPSQTTSKSYTVTLTYGSPSATKSAIITIVGY